MKVIIITTALHNGMDKVPAVKAAFDAMRYHMDTATDEDIEAVPLIELPDDTKKYRVLVEPIGE